MDITQVEVIEGHTVRLRFEDGTEKTLDLDPYLYGPVFEEIRRDPAVFAAVRVDADAGTIVWPNGADHDAIAAHVGRSRRRLACGCSRRCRHRQRWPTSSALS